MRPSTACLTVLLVAGTLCHPQPVSAVSASEAAWDQFTSARRDFQTRLCDLAVRRWPEYAPFFESHRDLQLAYIERRSLVFRHLSATQPDRIVRNKGGERFLNFAWSKKEDKRFSREIAGYAVLTERIKRLQSTADKFKKRDALRDRFARLELDPEYLELMRNMSKSIAEAEKTLAAS